MKIIKFTLLVVIYLWLTSFSVLVGIARKCNQCSSWSYSDYQIQRKISNIIHKGKATALRSSQVRKLVKKIRTLKQPNVILIKRRYYNSDGWQAWMSGYCWWWFLQCNPGTWANDLGDQLTLKADGTSILRTMVRKLQILHCMMGEREIQMGNM